MQTNERGRANRKPLPCVATWGSPSPPLVAMTLRRQGPMKRPAKAPKVEAPPKARGSLTSRRCLSILERVEKICTIPKETQQLFREAKRAAKSRQKTEQEKSASLLGTVMAKVVNVFEEEVRVAKDGLDKAKEEEKTLAAQQVDAETQLQNAKQAVQDHKTTLKETSKYIVTKTKALASASAERKSVSQDVKLAEKECHQLQQVQEKTYQPLKEAVTVGSTTRKQINLLCKAGQKVGFHQELLSIAPAVLKKELARRQTFDQLVLRSLDSEFSKRSQALLSKLQENRQSLDEQERAMDETQQAVQSAKETVKETGRKISEAEKAVETSKKSVSLIKKKAKTLPSMLKQAGRRYEQVSGRYAKFRSGPLATYLTYRPVRHIDEEEDMEEDATQRE